MSASLRFSKIEDAVTALYERNRQTGRASWCPHDYDFVCPSVGTYPFQWLWDSCFHAIVLTHLDIRRAESEIRSLLRNASPDGLVSHVTFWQRERYEEMLKTYAIAYRSPYLSDCMQPPLLAEAIGFIMERGGTETFLAEVLPATRRFYDWLDRVRDPDRDGLVATLQPDESGLDHTPKYDAYLGIQAATEAEMTAAWERVAFAHAAVGRDPARMFAADRFVVEDVLVNTIYAESERVLARLLARVGDEAGAAEYEARARKTTKALLEKCYDPVSGRFHDLAGAAEQPLKVDTISCLMPVLLPETPREVVARIAAAIADSRRYGAPFPLPTVSMSEPSFSPRPVEARLVWRGTVWINTNWYVARGLRRHGHADLARNIEEASVALVERSGFREHFDPLTGEGHGAHGFGWTALVLDMMAGW